MSRVPCPRCHGEWYRDLEPGTGLPYACYRCGNTGEVNAPHGACPGCGEALLEGEGEALGGICYDCTEDAKGRAQWLGAYEGGGPTLRGQTER